MSETKMSEALAGLMAGFKAQKADTACEDCGVLFSGWSKPTYRDGISYLCEDRKSEALCWDCDTRREQERARRVRIRKAVDANIPRRYQGVSLADYRCPPGSRPALEAAKAWSPDSPQGLFLWSSEKGTGKSHLAFSIARREIEAGLRVYATDSGRLFARMRSTFNRRPGDSGETLDDVMREVERCDVLVLDDLGTEKPTEWVLEQLFAVINGRYLDERPVVITSNHSIPEMAMRLGEMGGDRVASRLMEMCQVVEVKAADYRISRRTP